MNKKNKKKVLIFSPPFSGHLHPLICLAKYLKKHFDIIMISTASTKNKIESAGLKGRYIFAGKEETIKNIVDPKVRIKNNPFRLFSQFKRNVNLFADMRAEVIKVFNQEVPDLVIADFTLPIAGLYAEEKNTPWMTTLPSPCAYEGRANANAYLGGVRPKKGLLGLVRDKMHLKMIRTFKRIMFFIFRTKLRQAGIKSVYRNDGSERIYSPTHVFALGMRELEFDRNCYSNFQLTGPLLYTPESNHKPPKFIKGKKHILISVGTHLWFFKEKLFLHLKTISNNFSDVIFHYSYGDDKNFENQIHENLHVYSFISYEKYLNKYEIVIHHCGSGIMYECIKYGIPAIAFPIDYDQFDNSVRLELAQACKRINKLSELSSAIESLLDNPKVRDTAKKLSKEFKKYQAEELILQSIKKHLSYS